MIESFDRSGSFDDARFDDARFGEIEAMVRAAGGYVQVSRDLRPRVLESARLECGERQARRCIRRVALFAALVAWFTTASIARLETPDGFRQLTLLAARSHAYAGPDVLPSGDSSWSLVDAYTELRRRQAEALRLAL